MRRSADSVTGSALTGRAQRCFAVRGGRLARRRLGDLRAHLQRGRHQVLARGIGWQLAGLRSAMTSVKIRPLRSQKSLPSRIPALDSRVRQLGGEPVMLLLPALAVTCV